MRPDFPGSHAPNLTVTFAGEEPLSWPAVHDLLARGGMALTMRMIDGQPAFPDEAPAVNWREIRVAAADGMVTIRREGDGVAFVTWGNAGRGLLQAANALAWAFAETGPGTIHSPRGPMDAATFLRTADLPNGFHPTDD
jgi:hypothetical protein